MFCVFAHSHIALSISISNNDYVDYYQNTIHILFGYEYRHSRCRQLLFCIVLLLQPLYSPTSLLCQPGVPTVCVEWTVTEFNPAHWTTFPDPTRDGVCTRTRQHTLTTPHINLGLYKVLRWGDISQTTLHRLDIGNSNHFPHIHQP